MKKILAALVVLSLLAAPVALAGGRNVDPGRVSTQGFMYNK